jgi:nitrogen regulatory protein PII
MILLKTELLKIVNCLNHTHIDYGLAGGLAVAVHGYVRATRDIDILIRPDDLEKAREVLALIGYDLEAGMFSFDEGTEKEIQLFRVSRSEGSSLTTLDLMLVTPILEEVWNARETVKVGDSEIKVVSKAALIRMKSLSGRYQDLADIESLSSIPDVDGN